MLSLAACGGNTAANVVAGTTGDTAPAIRATGDTAAAAPGDTTPTTASASGDTVAANVESAPTDSTVAGATSATTAPSATATTAAGSPTTAAAPTATTAAPTASTPTPVTPRPPITKPTPTTTQPPVTSTPVAAGSRTFSVSAEDATPPVFHVSLGTDVTLNITSATDQEFHLHDIDLTLGGTFVRFRFTADLPGSHIVESHDTGKLICTFVIG